MITALTIPDIAAALDSKDGETSKKKYIAWFDKYVGPYVQNDVQNVSHDPILTGGECYRFRCSLLHQGKSSNSQSYYKKIFFIEPGTSNMIGRYNRIESNGIKLLQIDLNSFCLEIIAATRDWLGKVEHTEYYQRNYNASARRHLNSSLPIFSGATIIG